MEWVTAALFGASGGLLVQVIFWHACVGSWQAARRQHLRQKETELPTLRKFVDVPADIAAGVTRVVLGAVAGAIFHEQIIGIAAAVAVGASAPAVLQQLGTVRGIKENVQSGGTEPETADAFR